MNLKNSMLLANLMSAEIPKIYKVLDWIESTGTQYIDTGIAKTTNIKAKLTVQSEDIVGNRIIIGYATSGGQWFGTNSAYYGVGGTDGTTTVLSTTKQTCDITISYRGSVTAVVDNQTVTRNYSSEGSIVQDTYRLLGGVSNTNSPVCKMFSGEIKNNDTNTILANYIPVRRLTDNQCGMYDTVTKTFKPNAGTGKFIGSDEILLTVVGSPTITDGVVSGFSDSDYLSSDISISEETDVEYKFKFTTGNDITTGQYIFAYQAYTTAYRNCGIFINGGRYGVVLREANDFSQQYIGGYVNPNTTYYLKMIFTKSNKLLKVGISTDDITYTYGIEKTLSSNLAPINRKTYVGRAQPSNYYWLGSIDIPNCYMKLDGTKYIFTLP